jgi:anaerobic C4-dicarboxylate transporter
MNLKDRLEDRLRLHDSYKAVFRTEDGERVLRHLLKMCGIVKPSITTDANMLLIRQGQQHIVLSILTIINKDASEILKQIEEKSK